MPGAQQVCTGATVRTRLWITVFQAGCGHTLLDCQQLLSPKGKLYKIEPIDLPSWRMGRAPETLPFPRILDS